MSTARQLPPPDAPITPGRRRQDRALPDLPLPHTHHEKLRWCVIKFGAGWLREYRDGSPTWGGPQEAALFSDSRAADAIARELGGRTSLVLLKSEAST